MIDTHMIENIINILNYKNLNNLKYFFLIKTYNI